MKHNTENTPSDSFFTLDGESRFETTVKGSRFIGFADAMNDRAAVDAWLNKLSSQYHDASHCCYAYRISAGTGIESRSSDAGEPAGTAGRPILDSIKRKDLLNTACAVIRYFGGVKLGTGGLARAYAVCAEQTLKSGRIVRTFITDVLQAGYHYDDTGKIMSLVDRFGCTIKETLYRDGPVLVIEVRKSLTRKLITHLKDATSGQIQIKMGDG